MITCTEVVAAYGRKYNTVNEALTDWDKGYDFKIYNGPYCSKRDFTLLDNVYINININGKWVPLKG